MPGLRSRSSACDRASRSDEIPGNCGLAPWRIARANVGDRRPKTSLPCSGGGRGCRLWCRGRHYLAVFVRPPQLAASFMARANSRRPRAPRSAACAKRKPRPGAIGQGFHRKRWAMPAKKSDPALCTCLFASGLSQPTKKRPQRRGRAGTVPDRSAPGSASAPDCFQGFHRHNNASPTLSRRLRCDVRPP